MGIGMIHSECYGYERVAGLFSIDSRKHPGATVVEKLRKVFPSQKTICSVY